MLVFDVAADTGNGYRIAIPQRERETQGNGNGYRIAIPGTQGNGNGYGYRERIPDSGAATGNGYGYKIDTGYRERECKMQRIRQDTKSYNHMVINRRPDWLASIEY